MKIEKLAPEILRAHKGISFTGITTVFYCHDGKGNVLLAKRSKNTRDEQGRWDPGAGGLKHGVTLEENAIREIKEEYDVTPIKLDFIGYFEAFRETRDGVPTHWLAMCFVALVDPEKVRINEPEMIDDFGWYKLDNLPSPLHSQFDNFMNLHGDRLRELMESQ